jgi:hypothetical protein
MTLHPRHCQAFFKPATTREIHEQSEKHIALGSAHGRHHEPTSSRELLHVCKASPDSEFI